jgi:hypothetical protein
LLLWITVLTVRPHVQFKSKRVQAWQPEDKTKKFRSSLSSRSF